MTDSEKLELVLAEITKINTELSQTNSHLDHVTDKNIRILAELHRSLIDKLDQAINVSDKTVMYEIQVNTLTEKVNALEREMLEIKSKIA